MPVSPAKTPANSLTLKLMSPKESLIASSELKVCRILRASEGFKLALARVF